MARKWSKGVRIYDDPATDYVGVVKDTYIDSRALEQGDNFGAEGNIRIGYVTLNWTALQKGIIEVTTPPEEDLIGFDVILRIRIRLNVTIDLGVGHSWSDFLLIALPDDFDEGTGTWPGTPGECNWDDAKPSLPWEKGSGASLSTHNNVDDGDNVIDAIRHYKGFPYIEFDITEHQGLEQTKRYVIFNIDTDAWDNQMLFGSKENTAQANRPDLIVEWKDYRPDAFEDEDSFLKIEPNPDNKAHPKLSWGKVSDPGFTTYRVYRKTTPFTLPSQAALVSTINNPDTNVFIDPALLGENQFWYYMVTVEDTLNTGDLATLSALVSFKRPDCTHSEATETIDVGDLVTITLDSSIKCKKAYIEWGDSVDGYWVESETEVNQFVLTHRYSETGAKVIKARLESSAGYWSDLDTVCTKTLDDKPPEAVLIVRPLESVTGESVRCIGRKSQPVASDALISQYDYFVNGSWQTNKGPVFDVIPTSNQEIRLRIFTDTGETYTQGVGEGEDITVISGEPTDLIFSKDTTINSRAEGRESDAEVLGIVDGIGEIDLPYGIRNRVYTINGLSARSDFKADIDKIRDRQETQEYTRILVIDEKEGVLVRLDGRITGYRITQTTRTYVTWSFGFRVFSRTEV